MITTRKKQSFGIAAVELGAPVSTVPSIPVNLNEWEHAVLMDTFYSAVGSCLDSTILVKSCFHPIFVKQCDQPSILFYSVIIAESDRFLLTIPHNNYHAFP